MGCKAAVSKLIFYALASARLIHGLVQVAGFDEVHEKIIGAETLGYASTHANGTLFVEFIVRSAGLVEVILGLALIALGDTKLGYMAMLVSNTALALVLDRDAHLMMATGELNAHHAQGLEIADKVGKATLAANFVGLLFAGAKREGLRRSSSSFATFVLYTMVFVESAVTIFALMGTENYFEQMARGIDADAEGFQIAKVLTPLGLVMVRLLHTNYNVNMLAVGALLHTLKPTHAALALVFVLHLGIGAIDYHIYVGIKTLSSASDAAASALQDMLQTGVVFHSVCAGLVLIAAVVAVLSEPAPPIKSKKE